LEIEGGVFWCCLKIPIFLRNGSAKKEYTAITLHQPGSFSGDPLTDDDHQDMVLVMLHAGLEIDLVCPKIDIPLGRQIALLPSNILLPSSKMPQPSRRS
jgi:hypothetical protein|tara:strand:+ start:254 stop:550 length:297 start_codon:yes stop_codon:yes gene_type:complete